jgi:hypothetical protein
MKDLLKHLAAWLSLLLVIGAYSVFIGCASTTAVAEKKAAAPTPTKTDLIAQAIVNKEDSLLQRMFLEIMDGGEINSRTVTATRFGDGTEVSTEVWEVQDRLKSLFKITWENGVLVRIDTIEKKKNEHRPIGG